MNRRTVITVTLGLALPLLPLGHSRAAISETKCVWAHDVIASPGLSTSPSSGSWTSRGPQGMHFVDPFTLRYGAFSTGAPFAVEFGGDRVNGSGEVQGFEGDCAADAVTKYHAKGRVTIKG